MAFPSFSARPPPSLAVPVIGINSNIVINGVEFHVQTEDLGPRHGHLVTHVFRDGGCVVKSVKLDYSQHLDKPNLHSVLPRVMKAHHAKLIRSLEQGRLDSIPPCVIMRRSAPEKVPGLADIAREAGIKDLPCDAHSEAPSTVRSHGDASSSEGVRLESAPTSTADVWDRLIEEAHREQPVGPLSVPRQEQRAALSAWDRAVESARHNIRDTRNRDDIPASSATPAVVAYTEGLAQLGTSEGATAVVSLARAVQMDPNNREYRAALRRALDWLDEHS